MRVPVLSILLASDKLSFQDLNPAVSEQQKCFLVHRSALKLYTRRNSLSERVSESEHRYDHSRSRYCETIPAALQLQISSAKYTNKSGVQQVHTRAVLCERMARKADLGPWGSSASMQGFKPSALHRCSGKPEMILVGVHLVSASHHAAAIIQKTMFLTGWERQAYEELMRGAVSDRQLDPD